MKTDLEERLKQEVQIHAQEARAQRSTVREIYQAVTGCTGEPGDWNGAKPVLALIEERDALRARVAGLEKEISLRAQIEDCLNARVTELEAILTRIVAADEVDALILEAKALLNLK